MWLPIEVLELVIDQASDDHRWTVRQFSLTCAILLPRSRHHLFRRIIIMTREQLWSSHEFLSSRPWLVSLVQEVTLEFIRNVEDGPTEQKTFLLDAAPIHLLTQFPNLRVWKIGQNDGTWLSLHRSTLRCYRKYGERIRHLELHYTHFDRLSDFKGLISAFTSIESLSCQLIGFKVKEHAGGFPGSVSTNIQALPISTLRICTSVDSRAIEYLLPAHDLSGSKLKDLTLNLRATRGGERLNDRFELLEQSMMWLTGLSSLVLVLQLDNDWRIPSNNSKSVSHILLSATTILERVYRRCLKYVRVEILLGSIADLGVHLTGTSLSAPCKELEAALLTFPNAPLLVRDVEFYWQRARRAELWSPIIRHAFQELNNKGLLQLKFTPAVSPDLEGHESRVASLVISQDSTQVVTTSWDRTIIVWDMASGTIVQEWIAHDGSNPGVLALSPDGRRLLSSAGGNTLAIWSIEPGSSAQKVAELEGHADTVLSSAWSPDGMLIASSSADKSVRIWDGHTYQQRDLLPALPHPPGSTEARSLQFSRDGRHLAWKCGKGRIAWDCCVWTPLEGKPPKTLRLQPHLHNIYITEFEFDYEGRRIATAHGTSDKDPDPDACVIGIWDAATGTQLLILTGHSETVLKVSFSSDGKSLLSVSKDKAVRIWNCETWSGEQTGVFGNTESPASSHSWPWIACIRHDGKYMITLEEHQVRLWRTGDGSCVATISEDDRHIYFYFTFSPNGQFLVSGDIQGMVQIRCISEYIDE